MTDTTEYVSVPKVLTDKMVSASYAVPQDRTWASQMRAAWAAMLAAAPPPPSPWKDIESAPKDKDILVRGGTFTWDDEDDIVGLHGVALASWRSDRWQGEPTDNGYFYYRPTHYMLVEDLLALPTDGGKE